MSNSGETEEDCSGEHLHALLDVQCNGCPAALLKASTGAPACNSNGCLRLVCTIRPVLHAGFEYRLAVGGVKSISPHVRGETLVVSMPELHVLLRP